MTDRMQTGKFAFYAAVCLMMAVIPFFVHIHAEEGAGSALKYKSLMFDEEKLMWIEEAFKAHEQNIPVEILLPNLFPSQESKEVFVEEFPEEEVVSDEAPVQEGIQLAEAPDFYLKSILYFSPDNWSVWLNDKKLTRGENYGDLKIVHAGPNSIVFLWQGSKLEKIFPKWRDVFYKIDDKKYISADKNIMIDDATSDISFILYPNQSLISKKMRIVEGRGDKNISSEGASPDDVQQDMEQTGNVLPASVEPDAAEDIFSFEGYLPQFNLLKRAIDLNRKAAEKANEE